MDFPARGMLEPGNWVSILSFKARDSGFGNLEDFKRRRVRFAHIMAYYLMSHDPLKISQNFLSSCLFRSESWARHLKNMQVQLKGHLLAYLRAQAYVLEFEDSDIFSWVKVRRAAFLRHRLKIRCLEAGYCGNWR